MNDQLTISAQEAQKYNVPVETLLDRRYEHRYRCPETGRLRSPEDVNDNEEMWKNLSPPKVIKIHP